MCVDICFISQSDHCHLEFILIFVIFIDVDNFFLAKSLSILEKLIQRP